MAIKGLIFACFMFLALVGVAASCFVELRAWGYNDPVLDGYIRVNGQLKANSTQPGPPDGPDLHTRGINTVILDVATCTTSDLRNFDTWLDYGPSDSLVSYLQGLPDGTVLLGATFDEPSRYLSYLAVQALASIGADVTGVGYRWKFAFIAVVGCPSKTQFEIAPSGGDNLLLSADVTSSSIAPSGPADEYTCEACRNPCTVASAIAGEFYFKHVTKDHFVQCSKWKQCFVIPCRPGTVWNQSILTCDWP